MPPPRAAASASADGGGIAINDILIWVLVPVLSYLAGALFQAGYNQYFGLPDVTATTADPVSTFRASRQFINLLVHHPSIITFVPVLFLLYLIALPLAFYRRHGVAVLVGAGLSLLISFSVRPWVWAAAGGAVLAVTQIAPILKRGSAAGGDAEAANVAATTSPLGVKTLAIVAFFYASLFSAGYDTARFQEGFFITDRAPRYVVLAADDTKVIAAELLDAECRAPKSLPAELVGYRFTGHIRAFTLGDADTPPFRWYETDGLRSSRRCGHDERRDSLLDLIWM